MTDSSAVPTVTLNDGVAIPQLGFGVYQIEAAETERAVAAALSTGYRHVDTAKAYGNEAEVGQAVRGLGEWVFVTTKYFNPTQEHGYDDAKAAFDASFARLGLDAVDLYLIHFPVWRNERYVDAWKGLVDLREDGRLRSAGVSNFTAEHLGRIVDATGVTPSVNQIELHPYFQQAELRQVHADRGIVTESWSPLAQGKVLGDPVLRDIAAACGKTVSQVVLRWHLQLGLVVFPKSQTPSRIAENFDILDFTLSDEQMGAIEGLDRGERIGPDPATYEFPSANRS